MNKLFVMVGVPGSGKSTRAQELSKEYNAKVFSSDEYREKLFGAATDQSHNQEVFRKLHLDLVRHLAYEGSAILDATNITVKARKQVLEMVSGVECEKIAVVCATDIKYCYERNESRERVVPKEVIYRYATQYQIPTKHEGFDDVRIDTYSSLVWTRELLDLISKMCEFDQQNPHHKYKLLEHCVRVAENYNKDEIEYTAGLLHDIGKLFTQVIDEDGIAHYYNHDSIGAYELTCHSRELHLFMDKVRGSATVDDLIEVIWFVNWHMRAHRDLLGEKAQKKYRVLYGNKLFDRLIEFAENDKKSSGTYNF